MGRRARGSLGVPANPVILELLATRGHLFHQALHLLLPQEHPFLPLNQQHPGPPGSLVSLGILGILAHPWSHCILVHLGGRKVRDSLGFLAAQEDLKTLVIQLFP